MVFKGVCKDYWLKIEVEFETYKVVTYKIKSNFFGFSCQELPFGIKFDVLTLKVNFDPIRPLASLGGVL